MRAVVFQGPGRILPERAPEPELAPGDVLVEVVAAGICGTDLRIHKGQHRAAVVGRVPGHEVVGRVAESAGPLPEGLAVSDAVFVAPNIGCGRCRWCGRGQENLCASGEALGITLNGGFAERMVVPARAVNRGNLIALDRDFVAGGGGAGGDGDAGDGDTNSDTNSSTNSSASGGEAARRRLQAMVLAEPLACVIRGQDRLRVEPGEAALVFGAGPVGLLHIALLKARGAGPIICSEPSATRRAAALRAGADQAVDPATTAVGEAVADLTHGIGAAVAITAAPVPALQTEAIELAAIRGRVLLFGALPKSIPAVALDTNAIHYKELAVLGTSASALDDCRQAVHLIEGGTVDTSWMISHRFGIDEFDAAIAAAGDPTALKVMLDPRLDREAWEPR
ncbi:MAG: alcohol dehydrogenase catalytic domain-containing protein [Bifidobacteriaceae bacterium]|jgi:L-iditol 2-dehydrogenase|nr:alcohol dehydrogenase catalytic domain-containing protein [Bifidobacteriaceae bacterium]